MTGGLLTRIFEWVLPSAAFPRANTPAIVRAANIMMVAIFACITMLVMAIAEMRFGTFGVGVLLLVFGFLLICEIFAYRFTGRSDLFAHLVLATMFFYIALLVVATAGHGIGGILIIPVFVFLAMLIVRPAAGVMWAIFAVASIATGYILKNFGVESLITPNPQWVAQAVYRVPMVGTVLAGLAGLFVAANFRNAIEKLSTSQHDEKRLYDEVIRQKERMADFSRISADWFWETDEDHRLTFVSPGFAEMFGEVDRNMLGHSPFDFGKLVNADERREARFRNPMLEQKPFTKIRMNVRTDLDKRMVLLNSGLPVFDGEGTFTGYRGTVIDATQIYFLTEELQRLAHTDTLTELANRRAFNEALARQIEQPVGSWLVYLDLDHFKAVNDQFGHEAGDALLKQIAKTLKACVREDDTVARLGGDEFCILLAHASANAGMRVGEKILAGIAAVREQSPQFTGIGASIGIVPLTIGDDADAALRRADQAAYQAKHGGRNRVVLIDTAQ